MGFQATGGVDRDALLAYALGAYKEDYDYYERFYRKVRDWYNLYRCIYTGKTPPFKNVVMLPLLFSACWSDVANKAAISLSGQQLVEMEPEDPDAGAAAKRVEALVNQQFREAKTFQKMLDFLMSGDVYGTGILAYDWCYKVKPTLYRQKTLGIEYPIQVDVTTFDGPQFEVVDILDFVPQAGMKDIDDMIRCSRKYYRDLDDMEEEGHYLQQRGEDTKYDPESIQELRQLNITSAIQSDMYERQNVYRSWSQYNAMRTTQYSKPIELIDIVCEVPRELTRDGVRFRTITIANRQVPMRNVPMPDGQMRKHFRTYCPMPDMHYFHGAGKVEIGATMAASANKLVSNRLDVLDLVLQPAMFVNDQTELDTQNLVLWPGRVIKVHGETGDTNIRPLQWDLQAYPLVQNEVEAISRYIDMATGVQRDTIQGMLSGDRQTAREFLGRMEQARTRLGLEAKLFEIQVLEPLADDFRILNRLYLPTPKGVNMIGSAAQWDPDTGEPIQPETEYVDLSDLNMDARIRAIGASNMLSKSMQRQDMMTAMQAVSANPMMMQTTNWLAFANKFWRAFEFNPREMMQVSAASTRAAWQQMNDQEKMGPQGDQLEQLAPGILGPQAQQQVPQMSGLGAGLQINRGL
jgi:hypothetical protein